MKEVNNEIVPLMHSLTDAVILLKEKKNRSDGNDLDAIMSDNISKFATAFSKAQAMIIPVVKNKSGFDYKYANLASILEAIKQPFLANELAIMQIPTLDKEKNRVLVTKIIHSSGEWIQSVFPLQNVVLVTKEGKQKHNPLQQFGSGLSYLRRYVMASMCGIPQKDDDAESLTKKPAPSLEITPSYQLKSLCVQHGLSAVEFTKFHKIESDKPETVKHGVDNFILLKEKFEASKKDQLVEVGNANTH